MSHAWIRIAAVVCLLAVGMGAFGAHLLAERLEAAEKVEVWKTAVFYQLTHGIAILALALSGRRQRFSAWAWLVGLTLFSGSLYGLSLLEGARWLGPVTPLGGLTLMIGWLALAIKPPAKADA